MCLRMLAGCPRGRVDWFGCGRVRQFPALEQEETMTRLILIIIATLALTVAACGPGTPGTTPATTPGGDGLGTPLPGLDTPPAGEPGTSPAPVP